MTLCTIGHGTASAEEFTDLLRSVGLESLIDVRTAPGSRRNPQFARTAMQEWMPHTGLTYRWEADLGGFRKVRPDSPHIALRHPSFRAYADYMMTEQFRHALEGVLNEAASRPTTVMCAESLWWRCHRRLISDAATLVFGTDVVHIFHDGRTSPHRLTEGVRVGDDGYLLYDGGQPSLGSSWEDSVTGKRRAS